jgi:hypothetical protein
MLARALGTTPSAPSRQESASRLGCEAFLFFGGDRGMSSERLDRTRAMVEDVTRKLGLLVAEFGGKRASDR